VVKLKLAHQLDLNELLNTTNFFELKRSWLLVQFMLADLHFQDLRSSSNGSA
jgi:hypothetical protein